MLRFRSLCLLAFLLLGVGFASTLAQGIDVPPPSPTDAGNPDLLLNEGKLRLPAENPEEVTKIAVNKNNEISFKAMYPRCDIGKVLPDDLKFKLKYGACEVSLGWEESSFKFKDKTVDHNGTDVDVSIKGSDFTLRNKNGKISSGTTKCSKFGDNLEINDKDEYAVEVSATKSEKCNLELEIVNKKFIETTATTTTTAAPQEESSSISEAFFGSILFWIFLAASVLAVVIVVSAISVLVLCCLRNRDQSPSAEEELSLVTCISHGSEEVLATAKEKTAPKDMGTKVDRAAVQEISGFELEHETMEPNKTKEMAMSEWNEYPQPKHRDQYVDLSKVKSCDSMEDRGGATIEEQKPGMGPAQLPLKKDAAGKA